MTQFGLDVVNGIVIGPITLDVRLFDPNGQEYARTANYENDSEARAWATDTRTKAIAEVGPAVAERLGWLKPWEMRIYG